MCIICCVWKLNQTEDGIDMILKAVALFFVLELDNRMVHRRDFARIYEYFDEYIKRKEHKTLPYHTAQGGRRKSCTVIFALFSFLLLVITIIGAFVAPWVIMICW